VQYSPLLTDEVVTVPLNSEIILTCYLGIDNCNNHIATHFARHTDKRTDILGT
jgi:hypothetical protein